MGFKKYDANAEKKEEENVVEEKHELSHEEKINEIIERNSEIEAKEIEAELASDEEQLVNSINEKRKEYLAYTKKKRKINYILTGVLVLLLVGALVLILVLGSKYPWVMWVSLGIMGLGLIGTLIYSKLGRNKMNQQAENYMDFMFKRIDEYSYNKPCFSKQDYQPKTQMDDKVFMNAHFYKDLKSTKSRNFVSVEYNGKSLVSADLAGNILVKGKTSPMFLGRFYVKENTYQHDDKFIVFQLKGGQLSRPIDNVEGLKLVEGNDTYCIYTNDDNWKKVLNSKVLNELKKFRIDKTLIDVLFSIRKGYTSLGIDYCDDFMNIPVDKDYTINNTRRCDEDLQKVLTILDEIDKNTKA